MGRKLLNRGLYRYDCSVVPLTATVPVQLEPRIRLLSTQTEPDIFQLQPAINARFITNNDLSHITDVSGKGEIYFWKTLIRLHTRQFCICNMKMAAQSTRIRV